MPIHTGTPYVFGPMQISLPDGWTAEFDDGIHELLPADGDFVLHISGYDKDTAVEPEDLTAFARDQVDGAPVPVTLASGLEGITFDDLTPDQSIRYWVIRHDRSMIAITLSADPEDFDASAVPAQMVISTLKPWTGD